MKRSIDTSSNGHRKAAVLETEPITDASLEERVVPATAQQTLNRQSAPPATPETDIETQEATPLPPTEGHPESTPKRKKPIGLILAVLGVGAITAGSFGYRYWQYTSIHEATENATVAGHIHSVSTRIPGTVADVLANDNQLVQKGQLLVKLDPQDYQNKVQQAEAALLTAQRQATSAQASIALASETTAAKTTQAQGDVSGAVASISTAQAAVDEAESGVPAAQAAVAEAEAGIPAAQAQVAQANATLQRAQADYNRYNSLFQSGAVARQQLDTAKAAYEVAVAQKNAAEQGVQQAKARVASAKEGVPRAQAKLAQAREGVTRAQAQLTSSKGGLQQATASGQQTEVNRSQFEAAKAAIAQSETALKEAKLQLSYINITAPTTGRVGRKTVEVGQRVQQGTPLMAIVGNEYWVTANFKETQLERMKPGQPAEIKLDAFSHHPFQGRVESLSPASGAQFALLPPDNATGNFTKVVQRIPVKVVFDAQSIKGYESRITPGMSAEVTVEVK